MRSPRPVSRTGAFPWFTRSTACALTSTPTTSKPRDANAAAMLVPSLPNPMTDILSGIYLLSDACINAYVPAKSFFQSAENGRRQIAKIPLAFVFVVYVVDDPVRKNMIYKHI